MLALLSNLLLFFAESAPAGGTSGWGKFVEFWNHYLNFPGFEAWRFFNLIVFGLIIFYLVRKPLSEAFKTKREAIRADLVRAEEERQSAITELTAVEARLAGLDSEKAGLIEDAKAEAAAEVARLAQEADNDIERMRGQATSEIKRKTLQARIKLRRFSADESIRLAEEKIRKAMSVEKDTELVKANIQSIGGMS